MPSTRLILISHLATAATRRAAFGTGEEQLEAAGLASARAYRSDLLETTHALVSPAQTARLTAETLGIEATPFPALRDLDAGRWIGRSIDEIAPAAVAAWRADPRYDGHGGESLLALIDRMTEVLVSAAAVRGTTVAITHAAPVRAALVSALGAPPSAFWHIDVPPLAALVLSSDGRRWSFRRLMPLLDMLNDSG